MAVSYKSSVYHPNPYVLPIDLNLFGKVLGIKQQQYDLGAQKIQSEIDTLGTLDVMKKEDRDYLNGKINNLVSTVNGLGGQDYSDPNILNQIEGLGGDIYGDNQVITAISSTKNARKLLSGYDQMKTNPKLSKMYSEVNEAYDTQKVSQWINDGKAGTSYQGPSSPTQYVDYKQTHLKQFDKLKADLVENITADGLYILKDSHETITPERLMSMAGDLLTPEERGQMKRDAWFLYTKQSPQSPEALVNRSLQQYQSKIDEAKSLKNYYEAQANASTADPEARRRYNLLADTKANELITLAQAAQGAPKAAVDKLKSDPEEFMYQLYSQDYFRGLANRFSVNQTTRNITPNYAEMFTRRQDQAQRQFDARLAQDDKQFYDQLDLNYLKEGLKMIIDPETGKISGIPINKNGGIDLPSPTNINTENPSGLKVTESTLFEANKQLTLDKNGVYQDFLSNYLAHHPEIGIEVPSQSGGGTSRQLIGQQFLEGVNNQPGFQLEDLAGLQSPLIRGQLQSSGLNSKQVGYLDQLWQNYKAVLDGKGNTVGELPDGFVDAVNKVKLIDERIRANKTLRDRAVDQVLSPLSQQDKDLYKDYLDEMESNPKVNKYFRASRHPKLPDYVDPRIDAIEEKVGDVRKQVSKYLEILPTRDVFQGKTFDPNDKSIKGISNFVASEIARGGGDFYVDGNKQGNIPYSAVDVATITPLSTGMLADGTGRFYLQSSVKLTTTDGKPVAATYQIPISDENARKIGIERDPYDNINYSVNMVGSSGDIPVYGNKNLAVTVKVFKKNVNNINDPSAFAQAKVFYLDANGQKIKDPNKPGEFKYDLVPIPNTDSGKASEAYLKAYEAVQQAAKNPIKDITTEDFINYIINYKRK